MENIRCEILDVYEQTHSVEVRFFSDNLDIAYLDRREQQLVDAPHPEDPKTTIKRWQLIKRKDGSPWRCAFDRHIDIPLDIPLTSEAAHAYIASKAPRDLMERAAALRASKPGLSHVKAGAVIDVPAPIEAPREPQVQKILPIKNA